jgi:hypothetical protein
MRKLLTFLIALGAVALVTLSVPTKVAAGCMALLGVGSANCGAAPPPAGYTGAGDIKTGWVVYYATRAFSAATRGNRLVNLCNSTGGTDVLCADASSDPTTGNLVIPGSLSAICPGANCTIATFYDLTVGTNCGGSPCDTPTTAIASRAILTSSAIGSKSCGVATGARYRVLTFSGTSVPQPYSVSSVVKYLATAVNANYFGFGGGGGSGFGIATAGFFSFFASGNVTGAAVDTNPHAIQSVANSTSSFVVVDTSTGTTQNSAGTTATNEIDLFSDPFANPMTGALCEVGAFPAAFSGGDATALYNNQHTYWGF